MELAILLYAALVAFVGVFLGAISGGVGLILMPALILIGIPVQTVISSTKVASLAGIVPSLKILHDKGHVDWALVALTTIPALIGSVAAGYFVVSLASGVLSPIFGVLLIGVAIMLLLRNDVGIEARASTLAPWIVRIAGFFGTLVLSFFHTIVGGLGPLFISLYVGIFGTTYIKAAALARALALVGSVSASLIFVLSDVIDWRLTIVVAAAFFIGSIVGTHFSLERGERWVRAIVITLIFVGGVMLLV
jgi:uncharacterized protein